MSDNDTRCHICASDYETFEGGGVWWCKDCAAWETRRNADLKEDVLSTREKFEEIKNRYRRTKDG